MNPLTGGCLCGAVRYAITAPPEASAWCHCRLCQKASGAPAVAWIVVPADAVCWTKGEPARFQSSPKGIRFFCATCGSPMLFETPQRPSVRDVNTATLDDPAPFAPTFNVYPDTRPAWCEAGRLLPDRDDD